MPRFFVEMVFHGRNYHGWQAQPNAVSVQNEIEKAIKILIHEEIKTTGAGRTDTGVHAAFYVCHFDTDFPVADNAGAFVHKLNALLPPDIAVRSIYPVKPNAHARFSATSRTYRYTISTLKEPFFREFSWFCPYALDKDKMQKAADKLLLFTDFTSFSKLHTDVNNNFCKIYEANWKCDGHILVFTIKANRFLRNMVRSLVGTMVDIGRGKLEEDDLEIIFKALDRSKAGFSAPAHGLTLVDIAYNDPVKM